MVTGEEVGNGPTGNWAVTALAICAPAPSGYEVVGSSTFPSSAGVHETSAVCTGSKTVVGTGSQVNNPSGRVMLQLNRPDGSSGISRVTAKEIASGHPLAWNVTSYAVCTSPLPNLELAGAISDTTGPEADKVAFIACPANKFVLGAHAATAGSAGGLDSTPAGVAIQQIIPSSNLRSVTARARATTGSPGSWNLVAQATCAP